MTVSSNGHWSDEQTREQVKTRLDQNLYLEAGAGTGKTNALISRLSELLVTGTAEPEQIAAITFTRAAAFEMRSRLRSELERRAGKEQDEEKHAAITAVVDGLDAVAIQTIHSFALSMLREQPLEIGLPPVIEPLDDIQAAVEFDARWNEWLADRIESDENLAPALGVTQRLGPRNPIDLLRRLAIELGEQQQHLRHGVFSNNASPPAIATPRLSETLEQARSILATGPGPDDTMSRFIEEKVAPEIASMLSLAGDAPELPASDFAEWSALNPKGKGSKTKWRSSPAGEEGLERLRSLIADLQSEIDAALDALRQSTLATLLTAATDFVLDYAADRRRQGRLTFNDQLLLANRLLRDSTEARERLRSRFRFILVDEFQDTDPVQIELLRQLAGDESGGLRQGSLFIVGDPKQSIYRFRGADPASSSSFAGQVGQSGQHLPLSENHRSLPGILEWVNKVFAGWMKEGESEGQAPHRDLRQDEKIARQAAEISEPPVWWFGGERETGATETRKLEFEEISAIAVAAGEGAFRVRGNDGEWRDSTFADVAILMRRRTDIDVLEDALIEKNVPYVFDSQAPLFTSQDVRDLHACLSAIDDPSDQVATLAAVRSPAFSCTDTDLLLWKSADGNFTYLDEDQPSAPAPVASAFTELRHYHEMSRQADTATLVETFIRERRLREKSMLTRLGPERSRRLDLIVELASTLSDPASGSSITLRDFTRWIARQSEENARMPERLSQGAVDNAVKVMTIHGAKGLEFPIVVMTSAHGDRNNTDSVQIRLRREDASSRHQLEVQLGEKKAGLRTGGADEALAQEAAESDLEDVRLLYVAATRAKDHLLVSRYRGKSAKKALVKKIEEHLEGNEDLWCGWKYPGRSKAPSPVIATPDTQADHDLWLEHRTEVVSEASKTRYTSPTALKPAATQFEPEPKQAAPTLADEPVKPGRAATDLGKAVHAVLQHIDLLDWTETDLADLARRMAEEHNCPDSAQVANLARAALQTETMQQATAAARRGQAWREVWVAAPLSENGNHVGQLGGQIDLMFLSDDGAITLVDHKTDLDRGHPIEHAAEPYLPQMGAYAWCIENVTGMIVARAVLLFASRALSAGESEYEVPDLPAEKLKAAEMAVEKVSAPVDAS